MNEKTRVDNKPPSASMQIKATSLRSQTSSQAKPANHQQSPAMRTQTRTTMAPPAFRAPAVPKILQPKMHVATQAPRAMPAICASSGVVQANVVGGNHALQARLN